MSPPADWLPTEHPALTGILSTVAARKIVMGRYDEAIVIGEEIERSMLAREGAESVQYANARLTRAQALVGAGRCAEAIPTLESLLEPMRSQWGARHAQVGRTLLALARARLGVGDAAGALVAADDALVCGTPPTAHYSGATEARIQALIALNRLDDARGALTDAMKDAEVRGDAGLTDKLRILADEIQTRSRLPTDSAHAETAPSVATNALSVDLRDELKALGLPPRGQGPRNTCSVFTTCGAIEFALAKHRGQATRLSVEFLNWAASQAAGQPSDGAFFHNALAGFERFGVCADDAMPYQAQFDPSLAPSADAMEAAKRLRRDHTWP